MGMENGRVGIPAGYFLKMAKHDYEDYRTALAREFFQNSIDAQAENITVVTDAVARKIVVTDDGCGMGREVLVDKLLVLGGSHKPAGGVGAFGKAKELLFFSWESYKIMTGEWMVQGSGAEYELHGPLERHAGTEVEILIPEDESFNLMVRGFERVAPRMETSCKISIDGRGIDCDLKRGAPVLTVENVGTLYQLSEEESCYLNVRVDGIWMFAMYIGEGLGKMVLELERSSLDLLTSNRDGLKFEASQKVQKLVKSLMVDPATTLDPKKEMMYAELDGRGEIEHLGDGQFRLLEDCLYAQGANATREQMVGLLTGGGTDEGLAKVRVNSLGGGQDLWRYRTKLQIAGYEPNFVLQYERGQWSKIERFMGTRIAAIVAKIWTETVKQIMIDNEIKIRFTVGFTFNDAQEACMLSGTKILVNPWKIGKLNPRWVFMELAKDLALHELTHLYVDVHNEKFVLRMAEMRKNCIRSVHEFAKIQKIRE